MNILITGGYGNIGISVINACLDRGHAVSVFDVKTTRSKRLSWKYAKKSVRTFFGDIRNIDSISEAMKNQDAIIHLAAILPPLSDQKPELCKDVNVTGIKNIIGIMAKSRNKQALVEVSSASVMGPTQNRQPPVKSSDMVVATDAYSSSKIEAENLVQNSDSKYCILRLAAVLPTNINMGYFINMIKVMFDMPLDARCEIVLDLDVAAALVSAAENVYDNGPFRSKKGFIAGGIKNGCQLTNKEMLTGVFKQLGLIFPKESLFSTDINGYYLDWYDTTETQAVLMFQNHGFEQWKEIIKKRIGILHIFIRVFGHLIIQWLEKQSKYNGSAKLS